MGGGGVLARKGSRAGCCGTPASALTFTTRLWLRSLCLPASLYLPSNTVSQQPTLLSSLVRAGLEGDPVDAVRKVVFDASYMVMGLGDVYLGAPCAVPVDPRHRLVVPKYNPARTFTPEGAVGIGGTYMCIVSGTPPAVRCTVLTAAGWLLADCWLTAALLAMRTSAGRRSFVLSYCLPVPPPQPPQPQP